MGRAQANDFQFTAAKGGVGVTVLNARMSDFAYAKHAHEEFALGVTLAGVQEFACRGAAFCSRPGDVILFNPGDVHDGRPGKGTALRYTMLYLDPAEFLPLIGCAATKDAAGCRIGQPHFQDPALRRLILETASLATAGARSGLEYEDRLCEMAERLARRMGIFAPGTRTRSKDPALLRARDRIHDTPDAALSIDDLCRVAGVSKFHFIRLFRSQFGLTPHKYVLNHRINKAREALARGGSPTDIALDCGFFDASHLHRHFKRAFGVSPGQYQAQLERQGLPCSESSPTASA